MLVWCNDCNISTEPVSGELCVYLGSGWAPFTSLSGSRLTTGKKSDANAPVKVSATSATIKGVLVSNTGAIPTETGVVWREIIGTDFAMLPVLDGTGAATVPTYKTVGTLVTTDGAAISVNIPTLTSTTSNTRPYYFRTYAKTALGIGYGNPVIFNCAPPTISTPVVTGGTTLLPTFAGTLTVNAGTPKGTITEYGYCSGTTTNPTTANNKVVLSTTATLAALDTALDSETFTANPTVDLAVANYNVIAPGMTYFRYYFIANGVTTYSSQVPFAPNVVGGAVVSSYSCSAATTGTMTAGTVVSGVTQTITASVTTAGTYSISAISNGVTFVGSGTFAGTGSQNVVLTATGTPIAAETSSFVLNTSPNCSFSRIANSAYSGGSAVVSSYSCSAATTGTMTAGTVVSGVTQTITASVTTAGTYSISAIANGVTFAGSGTFAGTGSQNVVLTASGTPTVVGTSSFVLNTSPNCSFSRTISGVKVFSICDGSVPTTVVPITSTTGKVWMDRNLGASRAATSYNDYQAYGCFYQWGRGNDGHASVTWTSATAGTFVNGTTTTLSTTDSPVNASFILKDKYTPPIDWRSPKNDALWQGVFGTNNPCPAGYRVPTKAEFTAEVTTYSIENVYGAYNSPLKFVVAGSRSYYDGGFNVPGINGFYWSSTVSGDLASNLYFTSSSTAILATDRTNGHNVRCIKN